MEIRLRELLETREIERRGWEEYRSEQEGLMSRAREQLHELKEMLRMGETSVITKEQENEALKG